MKTFSFKLNKDGIAETNVPEEYFLNICNFDRFRLSYERNRWHSDECYGYKIKKEDLHHIIELRKIKLANKNMLKKEELVKFIKGMFKH